MKRKHWLILAAVLLCALTLGGCEKQEAQETAAPTAVVATRPPQTEPDNPVSTSPQRTDAAVSEQVIDRSTDNGVSWYITRDGAGYTLHVSGAQIPDGWINSVARFTNTDSNGSNSLISQIKHLVLKDDVTQIGGRAFANCTALTDVTLGAGVTDMGNQVFFGCQNLFEVQFTGTQVPAAALKGNTVVQYARISKDCTAIGNEAFSGCTALLSVDGATPALVQLGDSAFAKCTALSAAPDMSGLRIMGASVFEGCTALKRITFPQTLTSIGSYAFQGCSALQEIVFPQRGDMSIGSNAFENCTALSRVELTSAVYSADNAAFRGCTALISLTLGGQSKLGADLLSGCSNVTVTVVGTLPEDALRDSSAVVKVSFEGCRVVSAHAFSYCTSLKELAFREDKPVVIIGDEAFRGCSGLIVVELGSGLEEIGSRAFADCSGLKEITLPKSLKKIGSAVFANATNFADSTSGIRYEGDEAAWQKVTKPAQRTGVSWNAGISSNGDTAEPKITYLRRR